MKFIVNESEIPDLSKDNIIIKLSSSLWDDYNYKTSFTVKILKNNESRTVGTIRILHEVKYETIDVIPKVFKSLSDDFVSLGANKEFYETLIKILGKKKARQVLKKLNDISMSDIADNPKFDIDHFGIQNSLFRSSDARYLYEEVSNVYFEDRKSEDRDYKFKFRLKKENEYIPIDIDFSKYNKLPNRFFALIGKNGVGKTRLLNQLSESLYDSSNPKNQHRFIIDEKYEIPIYQKVIAISFSVFDQFFKGQSKQEVTSDNANEIDPNIINGNSIIETKKNNYTYIGIHKIDETVYTASEIVDVNYFVFRQLEIKERVERFVELLNKSKILHEIITFDEVDEAFFEKPFSSGQKIFISMLCRLLAEIEDGSLIFFDEPELYLHPNAIASLMNIFYDILAEYQSYAIICTHSPILVQEIPSRYVRNLTLLEGNLMQSEVAIETFGANISDITKDVYNVSEFESLYKSTFVKLSKKMSEDEIQNLFNGRLSLKAGIFLSSLYLEGEE